MKTRNNQLRFCLNKWFRVLTKSKYIFVIVGLMVCSGCGTIIGRSSLRGLAYGEKIPHYYPATFVDAGLIVESSPNTSFGARALLGAGGVIDLPISIALDTLLFPYDACYMQEVWVPENRKSQDFYGKVVDQDGSSLADVSVIGELVLKDGTYGGGRTKKYTAITDRGGLFAFTRIHGAGLGITISKPGYENEWGNDAYQNPGGGRSSPDNRAVYRMWSTNIHELLITGNKSFEVVPDGRSYFINLTNGTISEQGGGDLKVWIQYTNQVVRGQRYDWSAGMEVINGGLLEVPQAAMNSGFLNKPAIPMYKAPTEGYVSSFSLKQQIKGGQNGEIGNRYFYLHLNNGKEYGKMSINLFAPYGYLHPGLIRLSYALNPSGSSILR